MNGEVKCTATPPQQGNIGGRILNKASTSTQLSVLGEIRNKHLKPLCIHRTFRVHVRFLLFKTQYSDRLSVSLSK